MDLTKEEFEVLYNIGEGISDTYQLQNFTELDFDKLKKIISRLEGLRLVVVSKKCDENGECWDAKATEHAIPLYEKYKHWIPVEV